ncbi:hypothetical protein [uncultured Vagococcus sp.]|uniref:hypothetical protein n=1 Tax=uncultured Vagococcus sp. TaxID=189676 RepID=UPI0028D6B933|nr:hypothetical protein [uncultured Vagococcus sp.]
MLAAPVTGGASVVALPSSLATTGAIWAHSGLVLVSAMKSLGSGGNGHKNPNGIYEDASYHSSKGNSTKSKKPKNGQDALDNSVPLKEATTDRRVAVSEGEFVVLDKTVTGQFHGHVRSWEELSEKMKAVLIKTGKVNKKGKIK